MVNTFPETGQGLGQDLETGWPKLAIVKFSASYISRENTIYSNYSHKDMFKLIEIRRNILMQCHEKYIEVEKFKTDSTTDVDSHERLKLISGI